MKDETKAWLVYAAENLASAEILLEQNLLNACIQNVQLCTTPGKAGYYSL
jgi:hypothetical protein